VDEDEGVHLRPGRFLASGLLCLALTACSSGPAGRVAASASSTPDSPNTSAPESSGSQSSASSASPQEALVDQVLDELDPRARVAQLFLVGIPLGDLATGDAVVRSGAGGVFLAGRSSASAGELAGTTRRWQSEAPGPALWVAVDQEGGKVQSLKGPGFARLPSAVTQGALPHDQLAALTADVGKALHGAGINLNLAPVADVVPAGTEHDNAPIGFYDRQYGGTAAAVTEAAGTVVDGLAGAGVTATLKHFPGLGRVRGNPDTQTGVTDPVTSADDEQVAAFGTLADSPAHPFVMVSSATYPRIDPANQAMFSRVVLTELLRDRLAFEGVIVSDDVGEAEAVQGVPAGQRAVRFLRAGGTMVLTVTPDDVPAMIDEVVRTSRSDPAFARTVDAAVRIALLAKAEAGLLPTG
jgi:beta-N-acetylhexosaminidase